MKSRTRSTTRCSLGLALATMLGLPGCAIHDAPQGTLSAFERGGDRVPSIHTLQSMAHILAIQGRDGECEAVLEELIHVYPDHAPGYNLMAELFLRNSMVDEAAAVLGKGLAVAPRDPVLHNNLGMCRTIQGDYDLALESFRAAAESDAAETKYRANMAMALAMLGRDEESLAVYSQLVSKPLARKNVRILAAAREKLALERSVREAEAATAAASESAPEATATEEPLAEELASEEPASEEPEPEEAVAEEAVAEEPPSEEPVSEEPLTEISATEEPATAEAVAEEPVSEEPLTEISATEEPATEEPAVEDPVTASPPEPEPPVAEQPTGEAAPETAPPVSSLVPPAVLEVEFAAQRGPKARHPRGNNRL